MPRASESSTATAAESAVDATTDFVGVPNEVVVNPVSGLQEKVERLPDGTTISTVVEVDPSFRVANQ